jgi:hypothetical protein
MSISMKARKEVSEQLCSKYRRSTRKQKGALLDYTVELTGWCRKHAAAVLSGAAPIPKSNAAGKRAGRPPGRRGRRPKYGIEHKTVLKKVWAVLDFCSSVRLKAGMADALASMERHGHIAAGAAMRADMLAMSPSTMDRLLAFDRKSMALKGRATTKPGTLLKSQIPVRRGTDWDDARVGFVEIDTVAHCGHSMAGEFVWTLNMTDVRSGWTLPRAMPDKARVHTTTSLDHLRKDVPFKLMGVDSDNGSEFINGHFLAYCNDNDLVFTRGRAYTKNDGCFIEEKNWSVVRRFTGFYRLEGQRAVDVLNMMYGLLGLYINFFMPSQKLLSMTRDGAHVSRRHDKGLTPYRRMMADKDVPEDVKAKLKETSDGLDVLDLRVRIAKLQDVLKKLAVSNGWEGGRQAR